MLRVKEDQVRPVGATIKVDGELRRLLKIEAAKRGISIKALVTEAVAEYICREGRPE